MEFSSPNIVLMYFYPDVQTYLQWDYNGITMELQWTQNDNLEVLLLKMLDDVFNRLTFDRIEAILVVPNLNLMPL